MTLPKIYLALRSKFPQKFGSKRVKLSNLEVCSDTLLVLKRMVSPTGVLFLDRQLFEHKILNIFLLIIFNIYCGAQKDRLIERFLLSTHNICFGSEIRKLIRVVV